MKFVDFIRSLTPLQATGNALAVQFTGDGLESNSCAFHQHPTPMIEIIIFDGKNLFFWDVSIGKLALCVKVK